MFVIGKANKEEIKEMRQMGFEAEPVDVKYFDLALDPTLEGFPPNVDRYEEHEDELVSIFLDYDIVQEMRDIYEALDKMVLQQDLNRP